MTKKLAITGLIIVCCLTILGIFLYHKFKPGYVYENGTWNYVSYDEAVGRRVSPIDVKKDELKVLKYRDFARDNTSVYFKNEKVEESDPDTFQIISGKGRFRYAKDKNHVYIYARDDWSLNTVENADPNSFEVLKYPYSKDKNDANCGSLPLNVDDVSKFKVIERSRSANISSVGFYSEDGEAKTDKLTYKGYRLVSDTR